MSRWLLHTLNEAKGHSGRLIKRIQMSKNAIMVAGVGLLCVTPGRFLDIRTKSNMVSGAAGQFMSIKGEHYKTVQHTHDQTE